MHTTGLVVTLTDDPGEAAAAVAALEAAGPFTFGQVCGPCRAVALEAADPEAARHWHEWAAGLAGVRAVEVVFVHWDDATEPETTDVTV
ncbi:MAG: hypothetical protein U0871_22150 [Gemmataceae bacterium]